MTRRPGTGFENWVQEEFGFCRNVNSGARFGDGDLTEPGGEFIVECKDESGEAIRFPYKDLLKVRRQAVDHGRGSWVRMFRNGHGDVIVSMEAKMFNEMLAAWRVVNALGDGSKDAGNEKR